MKASRMNFPGGFVALFVMVTILIVVPLEAYPGGFFDPTDQCILTCDKCYKSEALLKCANHCLATQGQVNDPWNEQCPFFHLQQPQVLRM